jgi:tryptophan-rich sensory protein
MGYLALLVLVESYTLVICRSRSLGRGTLIGFAGWVWGIALTLVVAQHSVGAWLLLSPYLIWNPVGIFVTWLIQKLNR